MTIKTVVKNLIKNSSYLSYLYLKLSNKDKNFDRNCLFNFSESLNIIDSSHKNFSSPIKKNFEKIPNSIISKSINSVLGWVPFSNKKSSIMFYNFFSQNYSLRKNSLLRVSILNKGEIIDQSLFWIKPYAIKELDKENFNLENRCDSIILEMFNPNIKKNHGGHDGHLRFWGKYYDENKNLISTSHSMPLSFDNNFLTRGNFSRSYFKIKKDYDFNNFFLKSKSKTLEDRVDLYGYGVVSNNKEEYLSTWHLAPLNNKKNDIQNISQLAWCPNSKNLDPNILIDNFETGIDHQEILIAIIVDKKIIHKKKINLNGVFFKKVSDIFPEINNDYLIYAKFLSHGHSYFNIIYNNKNNFGDQVHSHETNWNINGNNLVSSKVLANGNTRKFFYLNNFKENCYHFLSLNIDNIENIKEINLNLRLLTDTGIEKISQKKIGFESPHLLINVEKEFEFIKDLNYGSAIIQLESYDHNINGSFLYCSKDEVIAVDHLTGG